MDHPAVFPAPTPTPPYCAVVFSTIRRAGDDTGYAAAAQRMVELAARQPGFLGLESVRGNGGEGITVSYWRDREAARQWGNVAEHREVQRVGRELWYRAFTLRICEVTEEWAGSRP